MNARRPLPEFRLHFADHLKGATTTSPFSKEKNQWFFSFENGEVVVQPFKHLISEIFMGDLGYIGGNHLIHEFKVNEREQPPAEFVRILEKVTRTVRSRIERLFGWFDKYKTMHKTRLKESRIAIGINLMLSMEYFLRTKGYVQVDARS